jgi:hypothetical protein
LLNLRDREKVFSQGEQVTFDGFEIAEPNKADDASIESSDNKGPEEVSAALGRKRV